MKEARMNCPNGHGKMVINSGRPCKEDECRDCQLQEVEGVTVEDRPPETIER